MINENPGGWGRASKVTLAPPILPRVCPATMYVASTNYTEEKCSRKKCSNPHTFPAHFSDRGAFLRSPTTFEAKRRAVRRAPPARARERAVSPRRPNYPRAALMKRRQRSVMKKKRMPVAVGVSAPPAPRTRMP